MEINRVLVVDDDVILLRAFKLAFEHRMRIAAAVATTRARALESAREQRPQLAIVDFQLAGESGLDVLADLRAYDPTLTVVIISAYGSVDIAVRAIKAGADEFLEKPIMLHEIFMRLAASSCAIPLETPSADRALWEHVHRVLGDCDGNKSEAARRLRRPRSWLRRFLDRTAPN